MTDRSARSLRPPAFPSAPGFTLIELLAVMAIVSLLVAIVAPKYFDSVERAKEVALRTDLRLLRAAIDQARADTNQWPASLQQLADQHYIRGVPIDPITDSAETWTLVPHPVGVTAGVYDVRSGAPGTARDGSSFSAW